MMDLTVLNKNEDEKHGKETSRIINYFNHNPHKPVLYDLEISTKLDVDDDSFTPMLKDAAPRGRYLK